MFHILLSALVTITHSKSWLKLSYIIYGSDKIAQIMSCNQFINYIGFILDKTITYCYIVKISDRITKNKENHDKFIHFCLYIDIDDWKASSCSSYCYCWWMNNLANKCFGYGIILSNFKFHLKHQIILQYYWNWKPL